MGRWTDTQEGRLDLVSSDSAGGLGWAIYRVLFDSPKSMHIETAFLARLDRDPKPERAGCLKYELFTDLPSAVMRCMEWMKS